MNSNEELIIEIFNDMSFEEKPVPENNFGGGDFPFNKSATADLYKILKNDSQPKSFVCAADAAQKALKEWKSFSGLQRSNLLHKIWKALLDKSDTLAGLKNGFPILVDYFDLYSDMAPQIEKLSAEPVGVVLIVLPPNPCFFILGATIPAALAAGCTIIVHTEEAVTPLFLEEIIINAGLPDGVFNVVTEPLTDYNEISQKIQQTVYCGSFSAAQDFYFEKTFESFKFFCPNNTAAFVLESCDLSTAVSNIFHKTWECASGWGVSTVIVQESIIQKFLDTLKFEMENFLNTCNNKLNFKNEEILAKINNVILEAVKAGAAVVKASYKKNEWGPTAILNYQNQEEDSPVLKILVCRTPKEGVKLLNNCWYTLGTSIWSEFSAQALEIASQLESPNIWINCHGIVEAKVPLSLTGLSGNFIVGGRHGILENLSSGARQIHQLQGLLPRVSQKSEVLEITLLAQKAFDSWHQNKSKRKYFMTLADDLKRNKEFLDCAPVVNYLTGLINSPNFSEKNSTEEFFIVYEEVPVGVLSLFISNKISIKELTFLITLPVALGNAVILVMDEGNSLVTELVNLFNKNLTKNLLSVVFGKDAGLFLASDPSVQALWLYSEFVFLSPQELRKESSKNLKHLWIIPKNVCRCEELILKQCMKLKIIWLPKAEKFP